VETGIEKLRLDNIQVFAVYGYIVVEMSRNALLSKENFLTPTYPSAGLFVLFSLYIKIYKDIYIYTIFFLSTIKILSYSISWHSVEGSCCPELMFFTVDF